MSASAPFQASAVKYFPLRLCEVLEKEFVTVHGKRPTAPSWLLSAADVDFARLVEQLRSPNPDPSQQALDELRRKLAGERITIETLESGKSDTELVDALNRLLGRHEDLYDPALLARDAEARRLAELRTPDAGPPLALGADEQLQLNRLLLEAVFASDVVARVDTVRAAIVFGQIHGLCDTGATHSALCLSGGGIRSAAFALGVIQGLARCGVLDRFDYLSTVSGGGYVGSWLSTWIHRHPAGLAGVVDELSVGAQPEAGGTARVVEPESAPVRFLRSYSHFLNPKSGLFSADTWTWIAIYLRNLSLNWLAIIPLLLLVVLVPRLYSAMIFDWRRSPGDLHVFALFFWVASAAAVLTLICVNVNRPSLSDRTTSGAPTDETTIARRLDRFRDRFKTQAWTLAIGVAPQLLFAVLLTLLVWGMPSTMVSMTASQVTAMLRLTPIAEMPAVLAMIGFGHLWFWGEIIVLAAWAVSVALLARSGWLKRSEELLAMLAAGALTWCVVAHVAHYAVKTVDGTDAVFGAWSFAIYPAHLYIVLAIPVVIFAVLAGMTVFIGMASTFAWIEDEDREWWARFGAWAIVGTVAWTALSADVIIGPALLLEFPRMVTAIGGMSGLLAVIFGKSSLSPAAAKDSNAAEPGKKGFAALLGPNLIAFAAVVFLAALLAFLSLAASASIKALLVWGNSYPKPTGAAADLFRWLILGFDRPELTHACGLGTPWRTWMQTGIFEDPQMHLEIACQAPLPLVVLIMLAAFVLLATAGFMVNLNKFSLHAAYRIRIVRTFLGASRGNDRKPNPFTGFDPMDNVQMHELQPGLLRDADIRNPAKLIEKLKQALASRENSPERFLVLTLCSPANDRWGILKERIVQYKAGDPVLTSLHRMLLGTANRVLETSDLANVEVFKRHLGEAQERLRYLDLIQHYAACGNQIFANRLLLETIFPDEIRPYDFPPPPPHKLIHVLNLTLNIVGGKRLAWQERKAAPFVVTPMHAGSYYLGFRESRDYGGKEGISIGTAAAISGAAVSPNMGYSSSPVTALLLTIFNVRLGWWLGNPGIAGAKTYRRAEPRFSLRPLVSEALGLTDDHSPYAYLSDGGHFENMGLYEMVLRRCKFIVVSDAGADPEYQFEDLGNAVRKIRIDFGIPIEFPSVPIYKPGGSEGAGRYCAVGSIEYSAVDGPEVEDGVIIVVKPVLLGNEPRDVANYAAQNKPFPQQPTSDQFFGESQFESYRQLGYFAVRSICSARAQHEDDKSWADSFEKAARTHLDPSYSR
jgi:Patatin-like phospholipase